eukprot:TRINITY_DN6136_c0_g1_i1.p1 TRINITY_DN6136_c0_g1~~TRINITY_DN6136_c0_g1_i1.p1  ORF type:complete len:264 (-),score=76.47 TRINITY_DN6136_c0_g1_i1:241-1032(-)
MIGRPPRSTLSSSSAASDVYKRQVSTQSTGGLTNEMSGELDELEAFLREVESSGPEKEKEINANPPDNIVKLLRDVNSELADAQRQVLQLRDENMTLRDRVANSNEPDGETDRDEEIAELHRVATGHEKYSVELTRKLEEARQEAAELNKQLLALPKKADTGPKGPAKRGNLNMGTKVLFCELIGGATLELSDKSQAGHVHVSKISLAHVLDVKTTNKPPNSFSVSTAGGAYIMTAKTEAEAKSWVRSVQISIQVALAAAKEK